MSQTPGQSSRLQNRSRLGLILFETRTTDSSVAALIHHLTFQNGVKLSLAGMDCGHRKVRGSTTICNTLPILPAVQTNRKNSIVVERLLPAEILVDRSIDALSDAVQ